MIKVIDQATYGPNFLISSPVDYSPNIPIDTDIVLAFNESVDVANINSIHLKSGNTSLPFSYTTDYENYTITLHPLANLEKSKSYTVTIDSLGIKDLKELYDPNMYVIHFSTVPAPRYHCPNSY